MSGVGDQHPRPPKDMKDLLRFCTEVGGDQQGAASSTGPDMTDEDKQWLHAALTSMTVDHITSMKTHLHVVEDFSRDDEERENALDELISLCEDIDFAKDFQKIGGYGAVSKLMLDTQSGVRSRAFELIAMVVQNNEYCQLEALKAGFLPQIMTALDDDNDDTVKIKALYALSCLVRNNVQAQRDFSQQDGFSVVLRAMLTNIEKLKIKAAFLLSSLVNEQPAFKNILCDIGMVEQLIGNLKGEHSMAHEHLASALLALVRDHNRSITECRRPELNLGYLLQERIQFLTGKEEFTEEREYMKSILDICFANDLDEQDR